MYTEDPELKIEEGHVELFPEHTEAHLENAWSLQLRVSHVLLTEEYKEVG